MSAPATPAAQDERALIFAPGGRDAYLTSIVLREAGIPCQECSTLEHFAEEIRAGAGAALLTEEALDRSTVEFLSPALRDQGPWSDLPLILLTSPNSNAASDERRLELLGPLGNVALLERPFSVLSLVSSVRSALRARSRQYQTRDLLHELEGGVRQRDRFLAMLGHELRTPLAAILTACEKMARHPSAAFASERALVARQTRHLSDIVDELLDVGRLSEGRLPLVREPLDLTRIVETALANARDTALAERIDLRFTGSGEHLVVDADARRMAQVADNLVSNAVGCTPEGGRIDVYLERHGTDAELRVLDTGVGIAPEHLEGIFELFSHLDTTSEKPPGGMGLGLSLTKRVVEMHGGTIEAYSAGVGKGSEFVVRLPVAEAGTVPVAAPVRRKEPPAVAPSTRHVLVIEDNADARSILKEMLEIYGHHVDIASNGIEGIEKALANHPDVALVDIGLPGIDGYQVARELRQSPAGREIRLVALTGYGQPDDRQRALAAGFDAHVTKPADMEVLQRAVSA